MNPWGNAFSYNKSKFWLDEDYAQLCQETVHLLIRPTVHYYSTIIFYKSSHRNCFYTNK
jgi:hypothetical protein